MLPFNIASYALLAHIIGKLTNMVPMKLIGDLSNVHLYENAWNAAVKLCKRDPNKYSLPTLEFDREDLLNDFKKEGVDHFLKMLIIKDFKLKNYQSYPNIPVEMLAPKN